MSRRTSTMGRLGAVIATLAFAVSVSACFASNHNSQSKTPSATGVVEREVGVPTPDAFAAPTPVRTPSISSDLPTPAVFMFCEPRQQPGHEGNGQPLAVVPDGVSVVYKPHTCEPDLDPAGEIAVRGGDRSVARVPLSFALRPSPEQIVWTPSQGDLHGVPTAMTAKFLQHNARVVYGSLGDPLVVVDTTDDGKQVLGSLTMRIIGLRLSVFIDGVVLRARDGAIYAPTVQSEIRDTLEFTGLDPNDARHLVDLLNGGRLE